MPLASVTSPDYILNRIADVLNLAEHDNAGLESHILQYLKDRKMLMVLDNFEHLTEGANIIGNLVITIPGITVIVTSRERLQLREEMSYNVRGLTSVRDDLPSVMHGSDAVNLFVYRADKVRPGHSFSTEDYKIIAQICDYLDGNPLAIEHAASWTRMLSCEKIFGEIRKHLDFLTTKLRDVPDRQKSLRAVFDYSWTLLREPEQTVLMKLAVFRGGFTGEAAALITGTNMQQITDLSDRSFITECGRDRFEMLETVRLYAREKLDDFPDALSDVEEELSIYYAEFCMRMEKRLYEQDIARSLMEISLEMTNVRIGLDRALNNGSMSRIDPYIELVYRFFELRSRFREGETLFGEAVRTLSHRHKKQTDEAGSRLVPGRLMARQGAFCYRLDQLSQADSLLAKSLVIFDDLDAIADQAFTLTYLGAVATRKKDLKKALQLLSISLQKYRDCRKTRGVSIALHHLGLILFHLGEFEKAQQSHLESYTLAKKLNNRFGMAVSLNNLGQVMFKLGRFDDARRYHDASYSICNELNDEWGRARALTGLGQIAFEDRHFETAQSHFRESLTLDSDIGYRSGIAQSCLYLGRIARQMKQWDDAKSPPVPGLESRIGTGGPQARNKNLPAAGAGLAFDREKYTDCVDILHACIHDPGCISEDQEAAETLLSLVGRQSPADIITDRDSTMTLPNIVQNLLLDHAVSRADGGSVSTSSPSENGSTL